LTDQATAHENAEHDKNKLSYENKLH